MTDITELLDRERFDKWLRSHNPAATVGESGQIACCPLATYLRSNGVATACVLANGRNIDFDDKRLRAPRWVERFVTSIDQLRDGNGRIRDHVKVRAYQAWQILDAIQ